MSLLMQLAVGVLITASIAFVAIGSVYKWDTRVPAYGTWTRITGAVAVLLLAGLTAASRIDRPAMAGAIVVGGILLAWGYVILHKRLVDRVNAVLTRDDNTL